MFSYGSGMAATMYSLKVNSSVFHISKTANIISKLKERVVYTPEQYSQVFYFIFFFFKIL